MISPSTRTRTKPSRFSFSSTFAKFPDFILNERREHDDAAIDRVRDDLIDDLLGGQLADGCARGRVVRLTDGREEQPQIIVNLCRRGDGGALVAPAAPLLDRNGRREALDKIDHPASASDRGNCRAYADKLST